MSDAKEKRLKALSLFKNADRKAISHLAAAADEVTVKAGHKLIAEGHHHYEIYVVEQGTASVSIDGTEVAEIPAGELVGELGYFVRQAASATVEAKTELSVLVIPYNRFDQILDDNPDLVRAMVCELAERLYATDAKLH